MLFDGEGIDDLTEDSLDKYIEENGDYDLLFPNTLHFS